MATTYEICLALETAGSEEWFDIDEIGVTDPVLSTLVAGVDTLTFTVKGATAFTDDTLFAYRAEVRYRRVVNGTATLLFLGRVQPHERVCDPSESYTVELRGMWDWFDDTPMRQDWLENAAVITKPRVILFCDGDGARITTGAQIEQCVLAAIEGGCPCAVPSAGDIDAGFTPPFDEQVNISVANAVCKALASHPHASCWFDYRVRKPRLYVRTRQSLTAVNVSVVGQTDLRVKSREDLQPTAVAICYEKENTVDGQTFRQTTTDFAPVVGGESAAQTRTRLAQSGALWGVFDLQGSSLQSTSQDIEVAALPASLADKAWWKARVPRLAGYADEDITLTSAARHGALDLPSVLVKGSVQKWMSVATERETFTVEARLVNRAGGLLVEDRHETLTLELAMTNAITKTYRTVTAFDSGEPIPEGVAAALWAEWQQLHYECSVTRAEEEPALGLSVGKTLNLTGGRTAWASMAAMIVRVTVDFARGVTTAETGVPAWIDIDSRVAWYRACRGRRYSFSRKLRGEPEEGSGNGGVDETPAARDGGNVTEIVRRLYLDPSATVKHIIDLYAQAVEGGFEFADSADGETARTIRPREVLIPYADAYGAPVAKLAQCLCSEGYGAEVPLAGATQFEAVTDHGDYLMCAKVASLSATQQPVPVDPGEEDETLYKVWKPWLLRQTPFDALTRDGITYDYDATVVGLRKATDATPTDEWQKITPSYSLRATGQTGELLHAVACGSGEYQDLNTAGRCWAQTDAPE